MEAMKDFVLNPPPERDKRLRARDIARSILPSGSQERKNIPITRGVLDYFPAALAEVAKVSKAGNDKHNPGQEIHHARGKSTDHADAAVRHLMERGGIDKDTGVRHTAEAAWRVLALLQEELEDAGLAPLARGARLPDERPVFNAEDVARSQAQADRLRNQDQALGRAIAQARALNPIIEVD